MSQPDSTSRPAVFVTGAAAGIGRAIAARFARQGWTVGLYDIDAEAVRATAAELGGHTVTGCFDVTDPAGWEQALKEFADATGRLDVLVNNAGILYSGAFGELPIERHHRLVDVNVKGVLNGCHTALPYLRRTPGSRVVNLASAAAFYGQPGLATYGATKAAVRSLTEALDLEWRHFGIEVSDLLPLFVATDMMTEVNRGSKSATTLGVRLTPDDVADAVWHTATHRRGLRGPHVLVGLQTKLTSLASRLAPPFLARAFTGWISEADSL
ncbi:SDR family oxidoreductase [Nocardia seriolae]|nr:SDR family oxidoreductase [Nocardia seriolae]MTJ73160.1 SDR family oxidoreductase [Nocardia seriolae]MTJ89185.1 SDR family oxidoreductase [Nocardia seriolae]MTK33163.1 SDR family oxidoreductase [Nocardia seriolae]MTK42119.1 SDR family oxidoreductase [Nocardia seriolae]